MNQHLWTESRDVKKKLNLDTVPTKLWPIWEWVWGHSESWVHPPLNWNCWAFGLLPYSFTRCEVPRKGMRSFKKILLAEKDAKGVESWKISVGRCEWYIFVSITYSLFGQYFPYAWFIFINWLMILKFISLVQTRPDHTLNCLFDISTWVSQRVLRLSVSKPHNKS